MKKQQLGDCSHYHQSVQISSDVELVMGDCSSIGADVVISGKGKLVIGDYAKIHRGCWINAEKDVIIGHNCWIGERSILDGTGGLYLGNNVGVGAGSQLWSHMSFGDTFSGCRLKHSNPVTLEDEVWLCGPVLVQSSNIAERVVVLGGSNVTQTIGMSNTIWSGNPLVEVTAKMGGPPWREMTVENRLNRFNSLLLSYVEETRSKHIDKFVGVASLPPWNVRDEKTTYFDVDNRQYTKSGSHYEQSFMRWLLTQNKAKFVPVNDDRINL